MDPHTLSVHRRLRSVGDTDERRPKSEHRRGPDESEPLRTCLKALDELDAARRQPSGVTGRYYQASFARYVSLRGELDARDRAKADEYSQLLWRRFGRDLEAEAAAEKEAVKSRRIEAHHVDQTPTGRHARPTKALPGTRGKVLELQRRRRLGMELHAPSDVKEAMDRGVEMTHHRNGAPVPGDEVSEKILPPVVAGFAANLRAARRARSWGQATLARRAELSQQLISSLEKGYRRPSIEALRRLAEALGVSADSLLGVSIA